MINVMARIVVKPEFSDRAREILATLVAATRQEPGCRGYSLFRQANAAHVFQTVEEWVDQAAVDAHMATPHIGAALAAAGPMFAAPPEILAFEQLM